jgi:hypothetical protein
VTPTRNSKLESVLRNVSAIFAGESHNGALVPPCSARAAHNLLVELTPIYILIVLDGYPRIVHWIVTQHSIVDRILQQCRMVLAGAEPNRSVIHDRDSIFSASVDQMLTGAGITVLKTAPYTNAVC